MRRRPPPAPEHLALAALAVALDCPLDRIDELCDRVHEHPLPSTAQAVANRVAIDVGRMLDER